jgi:predicted glycosyltransferase involved in capsule biosynthesis
MENQNVRYNLQDVTFLIPIRIDSEERRSNLETCIKVIAKHFDTKIIILEADEKQLFDYMQESIEYHFVFDQDPIFHRTKYRNQLIRLSSTPIVGIWDVDVIAKPNQIFESIEQIRSEKAIMALPYDGRCYCVNNILSILFKQTLRFEVITDNVPLMHLMNGFYSRGGAFFVNKTEFMNAGGESENFYGWGPEDIERVCRLEILNLPIYLTGGLLFHLWHPIRENSWYSNLDIEIKNRTAFLNTCKKVL